MPSFTRYYEAEDIEGLRTWLHPYIKTHNNITWEASFLVSTRLLEKLDSLNPLFGKLDPAPPIIEFRCRDGYVLELGVNVNIPYRQRFYFKAS